MRAVKTMRSMVALFSSRVNFALAVSSAFLMFSSGCNSPTNQDLAGVTGFDTFAKTNTVNGPLGNQAFSFSPSTYDFGNKAMGSAPTSTTVTLTNSSSYTVYISNVNGLTGAFSNVSDTCPRSPAAVAPGATCNATVSYSPLAAGIANGVLQIVYGTSPGSSTSFSASMSLQGNGVSALAFTGIGSVSNIYSTQLKLNWTHVAGALMYYVYRVNADNSLTLLSNITAPTASYIVSGLTPSTSYRFWVRATDTLGAYDTNVNIVTTSTNTTPPAPVLSGHQNFVHPSNAVALGSTLSFDLDDSRTGSPSDSNVTYACYYDQSVNSAVGATPCTSLPGGATLNTSSGVFSWTPTAQSAIGFYEFKLTVTDNTSALVDTQYIIVDVKPAVTTTGLLSSFDAVFANQTYNQTSGTIWKDNLAFLDGTLNNFSFGGATGWKGIGISSDPYRLTFDGVDDYVDLSTLNNASTSVSYDGWINSSQMNTNPKGTIVGNADSSGKGVVVREAKGYRGRIEAVKGSKNYVDEVLADTPVSYLRLGDVSGDSIYDIGSSAHVWTPSNVTYEQQSPLGASDKGVKFTNASLSYLVSDNTIDTATWSGVSYEVWVKFNSLAGTYPTFFTHSNENNTNAFFWFYEVANSLRLEWADGTLWRTDIASWTPSLNTWYHIVVTLDFTSKAINYYVNGTNIRSATLGFPVVKTGMVTKKVFVGNYWLTNYNLDAYLDEPAVYDHVISPARVTAHYNAGTQNYSCLSSRLDDSKWNHFAAIYDDPTTALKLFTNSNLDCSITTTAATINGSSALTSMGAALPSAGSPTAGTFLNGSLKEVRAYNAAITNAQVDANMAATVEQIDIVNSVSGLNLWLKADAITGLTDGSAVATWSDASAAARSATQATASLRPLYKTNILNGKPVVRFDGVDDQMNITGTNTSWSVLVVARQNAIKASSQHILTGNAGTFLAYLTTIGGSSSNMMWYMDPPNWATYQTIQSGLGITNFHINTYIGSTTTAKAYIDGVQGINNTGTFTAGYLTCLANYSCADTRWLNGDIAEVIAYSGTMTEQERKRIEGYLKAKYGL